MQYQFSNRLKTIAFAMMGIGVILYGIGFFMNYSKVHEEGYIEQFIHDHPDQVYGEHPSAEFMELAHDSKEHEAHVKHLHHQLANRPWAALYTPAYLFLGIAGAALFFLAIQHAAHAGWSIVVARVMEGMASYIPVGGVIILLILLASAFHGNHMFHWMDQKFYGADSPDFDKYMKAKQPWLNIPFWLIRSFIYVALWTLFLLIIKKTSKRLDDNPTPGNYSKLYNVSVGFIVVFALTSAALSWDWIMSLDPHWFSSLFMWYNMVSYLVVAVSFMAFISIYLKGKGALPLFNDNHQHDLAKFMFGFSLLWSYLWFAQFLLQWYANVPEEVQYFQQRDVQYNFYYYMLVANLLLPLLGLISSSIKRNPKMVMAMAVIIFIGHFWDFYNQIMPATVGPYHNLGPMEIGALMLFLGLFIFVVFRALSKLNLEHKGHPMFHESKIYEYPF